MPIPKHEPNKGPRKGKKPPQPVQAVRDEPIRVCDVGYYGLSEVAQQLEGILKVLGAYHYDSTIGEHSLNLFTAKNTNPVRLKLEGEAVDSIADSLKRIADALPARG
jgi:hypothetical protein